MDFLSAPYNFSVQRAQSHTRHILPPSEIDLGLFWAGLCLQAQEGNNYFTELAERVEYGNYAGAAADARANTNTHAH